MIHYSQTTRGFYCADLHGDNIPADAVEITREEHAALMAAQATGKVITPDANGYPIAADPPPPSEDMLWERLRRERDRRLSDSDKAVLPDRWEGYDAATRAAWAGYRQALRDLPEITADPTAPAWPVPPGGA